MTTEKNKELKRLSNLRYREKNKDIIRKHEKEYRDIHKDEINKKQREHRLKNKKKVNEYQRKYYHENKDRIREYEITHKEELRQKHKTYYQNNKDKTQTWRKNNPEKSRIIAKRSYDKRQATLKGMLTNRISTAIKQSLNGNKNGRKWEDVVGYTLTDLVKRLKLTLPEGYTWKDYVNGADLHIDHIIPISLHEFKSYKDDEFRQCWALKNLQLLPAKKNMSKGNKLLKSFQHSLQFGQRSDC